MVKHAEFYTNYKNAVGKRNVIILAEAGSELLGLNTGSGDRDEMGVCLETLGDLAGFQTFDTDVYRTAQDRTGKADAPSIEGDIDLTIYGLRKYLKLALGGNPNLVNLLFTPPEKCLVRTFIGAELQALAPKIISKQAGKAFLGYLQAQRLRLLGERGGKDVNRPELVAKYGYDTKYAMHMLRLAKQGVQLLSEGALTLPMEGLDKHFLLDVKSGKHSLDFCLNIAADLEGKMKQLLETSPLQDKPDTAGVEAWMLNVYANAWRT